MKQPILTLTKKDFIRQTFICSGNGGQNINKLETGVRFIHEASGARAESCTYRTQGQNEKEAFSRLARSEKMQRWLRIETAKRMNVRIPMSNEEIQELVDERLKADEAAGKILLE